MKKINLLISGLLISFASLAQVGPITGTLSVCEGSATALSCSPPGGTWYSIPGSGSATVGPSSGVVTGVSAGTVTISYDVVGTGSDIITVTVDPSPATIVCSSSGCAVCMGDSMLLTDGATGGTWSSSNPGVATVGSGTGVVTSVSSGAATITYMLPTGCYVTSPVVVNPLPAAYSITGGGSYCAGGTGVLVGLSGSSAGVVYQLYLGGTPVGSPLAGTGGSLSFGPQTAAGVYTVVAINSGTGCRTVMTGSVSITVNPAPTITGTTDICVSGSSALTGSPAFGTWSSSNPSVAIIGSVTGIVTGVSAGTALITYTAFTGCFSMVTVNVISSPAPVTAPAGSFSVCVLGTVVLTDASAGGVWISSNPAIATAGSGTGVVTGITVGVITITYTLGGGCVVTTPFTVNPIPPVITGLSHVCIGASTTLSDASPGGLWSGSNPYAVIGSSSGVVSGIAMGTAIITYTLPTGCFTTLNIMVDSLPCTLGITEQNAIKTNVTVFPNPAENAITIKMNEGAYGSFSICNNIGQVMMQKQLMSGETTVDIHALPPAIYYISFRGENGITVKKFLKNRVN